MQKVSLLQNIYDAIGLGDSEKLKRYVSQLPVDLLEEEVQKNLFVCLMKSASKSPMGLKASRILIDRWIETDIVGGQASSPVYFLMHPDVDMDIISNMVQSLDNWDYVNYAMELIHQDSSPAVDLAMDRLDAIYDVQTQDVYQLLLAQIEKQRREEGVYNHVMKRRLKDVLEIASDYAPIPPWIKNYYGEPLPSEGDPELEVEGGLTLAGIIPDAREAAKLIVDKLGAVPLVEEAFDKYMKEDKSSKEEPGFSCPMMSAKQRKALEENQAQIEKMFLVTYNSSTLSEKLKLLGDVAEDISEELLRKDQKLFTIFGPANPIYGQVITDPESDSVKYGGCRMLTCVDFENEDEFGIIDDEDPYANIEWFTGNCEYCNKKIAKKIYALRRPLTFGGWKGEFCSFKCLRDVVPFDDVLNHFIINQIERQLLEIGIQDRYVSGENEINNEELNLELEEAAARELQGEGTHVSIETLPESFPTTPGI